jgi:hypothetical protein
MSELDLVISSCTAPLHLAGALGVPTWALLPFAPYFPWLLDRSDSAWYPTMRLYRQEQPGMDWSGVIARVGRDLERFAASWGAPWTALPDRPNAGISASNSFRGRRSVTPTCGLG